MRKLAETTLKQLTSVPVFPSNHRWNQVSESKSPIRELDSLTSNDTEMKMKFWKQKKAKHADEFVQFFFVYNFFINLIYLIV